MEPTKGSSMILKASPANGALSSAGRSISLPLRSNVPPTTRRRSRGSPSKSWTTPERRLVVGGTFDFIALEVGTLDRGNVERRRQIGDHRVQQGLHALVLEGRT